MLAPPPARANQEPFVSVHHLPEEVALKSLFLGPRSENAGWLQNELSRVFEHWFRWRTTLFRADGRAIAERDLESPAFLRSRQAFAGHLDQLLERLESEIPKFSPRYVGHMVSEISLPALLGHIAAVLHNPNNVSADVAPVGEELEREAIGFLLEMVGFDPASGRGHFTSGGTVANVEALWRARYRVDHWLALGAWLRAHGYAEGHLFGDAHMGWERFAATLQHHGLSEDDLRPFSLVLNNPWRLVRRYEALYETRFFGPVVLVPRNKHYSWNKAVSLLGLGGEAFWEVELDDRGKLDVRDLEAKIHLAKRQQRPILAVVTVAGTTEMGEVDPVDEVQTLLARLRRSEDIDIWHHVDAAYGGFFCSLLGDPRERSILPEPAARALQAIASVDSLTVDPHKLGYVPYSCGALLVRDALHYQVSSFSAPYLRSEHEEHDSWNRTLEGSRPATGAAATWLTARTIGLGAEGYGRILARSIAAKQRLETLLLEGVDGCVVIPGCDTNILCFCVARRGEPLSKTNQRSRRICRELARGDDGFFASKTDLDRSCYRKLVDGVLAKWQPQLDASSLCLVRLVLMNPFILSREPAVDYLERLAERVAGIVPLEPRASVSEAAGAPLPKAEAPDSTALPTPTGGARPALRR